MPRNIGPGPAAYGLPPVIGYEHHDFSRYRNPQYSIRGKFGIGGKAFGPGPQYTIDHVTRNGKVTTPAYSCSPKLKPLRGFITPGPGAYSPELAPRMKDPRPPAYTIAARQPPIRKFNTPGPNQYTIPSTLGPRVPHKPAAAAFTMAAKHDFKGKAGSPGPAQYGGVPTDVFKNKNPQYTIRARCGISGKAGSPGPAAYFPALSGPIPGGLSFGQRVDKQPYITAEDHMPCID